MAFVWLMIFQAVTAWTMLAQGHWDAAEPPVTVRLEPTTVSMRGPARIEVEISAPTGGFAVSRFIAVTTGIALDVRSLTGDDVKPLEPMAGSPPPPPLGVDELTEVTPGSPFCIHTVERSRTLFPGPGTYRVSAILALVDGSVRPARHARARSEPVTVHVTE